MITGIILASGFSKRMENDKLVLELNGIPMIENVILAAKNSILDEILIVLREEKIKKIADRHNIKVIFNKKAFLGQSESVKLGVSGADEDTKAYLFLMGDQPFITCQIINQICGEYKFGKSGIIVPVYNGRRGNPVLFSSIYKDNLLKLEGDMGGRAIINKSKADVYFLNINSDCIGLDIDTYEDYLKYKSSKS